MVPCCPGAVDPGPRRGDGSGFALLGEVGIETGEVAEDPGLRDDAAGDPEQGRTRPGDLTPRRREPAERGGVAAGDAHPRERPIVFCDAPVDLTGVPGPLAERADELGSAQQRSLPVSTPSRPAVHRLGLRALGRQSRLGPLPEARHRLELRGREAPEEGGADEGDVPVEGGLEAFAACR